MGPINGIQGRSTTLGERASHVWRPPKAHRAATTQEAGPKEGFDTLREDTDEPDEHPEPPGLPPSTTRWTKKPPQPMDCPTNLDVPRKSGAEPPGFWEERMREYGQALMARELAFRKQCQSVVDKRREEMLALESE